jgi:putative ABC transport system permease protein
MFENYFKIALRNINRNKVYSGINIFGLSLGVSCCLLLALYVLIEMSFDKHHERLDDLYRVTSHFQSERGLDNLGTASPPIAFGLKNEIPEIEVAARMLNPPSVSQNLIRYEDNIFYETEGFIADSTIFDVLTYEFLEGNPKKALTDANTVVITDKLSKKLFGNEPASNKIISISQGATAVNFKVTGVIKDNDKTFVHANFITSMTSQGWAEYMRSDLVNGEWAGQNFVPSYLKLTPGHNKDAVVKKIKQVLVKYGTDDMKALGITKTLGLEPVKDIYLKSGIGQSPRIIYLYVIGSIAVFILLIACINFMNLSTARATKRAAEIGVRKVMGAFRSSLVGQILGEAMVIVLISILLSTVLVQLALPYFNELTGKNILLGKENISYFILALLFITIFTGLVAGSYPAFYLSSFQPAQVLKGKFNLSNASGVLRRSLVVFQFMIAIVLVCGMIIIGKQLKYLQEKDLGFNADAKIILPLRTNSAKAKYKALQSELTHLNSIKQLSAADYMPGERIWNDMLFYIEGGSMDNAVLHYRNVVDVGFQELLDIKLIAGRNFTDNREMESQNKVIVNETSVKKLGFEIGSAVGQHIYFDWQGKKSDYEIIGVMEDYHQTSLKEEIKPTLFEMSKDANQYKFIIASVSTENFSETLASVEKAWKQLVNDTPFEYLFLNESIQKQYDEDRRVSRIITSFTIIAMFISCLGLYGLSSFMAERRFKEIGVRKVMGASVNQIVRLMSKEFVKLIIIAFIISVPLAWYAMDKWLESFAYKISIDGMVFVYAGATALIIALLTVSFESIKAATTNPVDSLRNE